MSDITADRSVDTAAKDSTLAQRAAGVRRYLTFSLAGEVYALDINEVTEIIEFRTLTKVPMMPDFIRGVINLRGRVLPVIDLAARFGQGMTTVGRRTGIIVVEMSAIVSAALLAGSSNAAVSDGRDSDKDAVQEIGVMVDTVNKVVHLSADDIKPPPAFGAGVRTEFIDGMAKLDEQFIVMLDIAKVLCLDDIATLSQVTSAVSATNLVNQGDVAVAAVS